MKRYEDVLIDVFGGNDFDAKDNFQHALDILKGIPDRKVILETDLSDEQASAIYEELIRLKTSAGREFLFIINNKSFLQQFGVDVSQ